MEIQYVGYKPRKILNSHKHADSWFWDKYSAHPYIGCEHGCEYCYSRETKYSRYKDPADFSKIIKIKENAPELLRKELSRVPRDIVIVGDYQPIEQKTELSQEITEKTESTQIALIGNTLIIYKKHPDPKKRSINPDSK